MLPKLIAHIFYVFIYFLPFIRMPPHPLGVVLLQQSLHSPLNSTMPLVPPARTLSLISIRPQQSTNTTHCVLTILMN